MSVLARKILCPRPCSLCLYVCNALPRQAHPPKVKYSLSAVYEQAIRQNISVCEGLLVLEDHYIHTSRENKALDTEYFWPIQTHIQAKREREKEFISLDCAGRPCLVFPFQNCGSLTVFVRQVIMMCGYVTGFEELFKSNQIDSVIELVSGFQVLCKEIKSNAVSKLFILVWSYEGMKVLDLIYENSYENFSITPICHIFSNFPAVFYNAQVTNRHGFRQLWRTTPFSELK